MKKQQIAIIGCGDYVQRWEADPIRRSERIEVKSLFDLDTKMAETLALKIGGTVVSFDDEIFKDPEIDIVCIFVPPWSRRTLIEKAVKSQKHIITTKPLAQCQNESTQIIKIVDNNVKCGVFYGRTGDAFAEACKNLLMSNAIGQLALYRQDWIHHYPTWNMWATDREKNGGPFMDAMIHNLNLAKYLMGRRVKKAHFYSDNLVHPDLKCNDTEFMKVDFENNGSAYLFITWAADLEVFDPSGNDREHIDLFYMVTDQGWYIRKDMKEGKEIIWASREGEIKTWPVKGLNFSPYDSFAISLIEGNSFRGDIISIEDAHEDIAIIEKAKKL
jgi:predicted dehydrogenase